MKRISLSLVFIATTILIVLAISYFYLNPSLNSAWQNYKEIKKSEDVLKEIAQKKEILQKFAHDNQVGDAYTIALNYIPEEEKSGDLVIGLSEMAKQSNLKVEQISFDKAAKSTGASDNASSNTATTNTTANTDSNTQSSSDKSKEIDFSMKISGTFADFMIFINNLEKNSRLVTINAMDLTQSADKGFSAELEGKAYYQKTTNLDTSLTAINISPDVISKFKNLKSYGQPINLQTESGFGRPDPFSTY